MIANKRLSKDALEIIQEFKDMIRGAGYVEVNAIEESRGYIWGVNFKFYDETKDLAAEETYLTMKGHTRRASAFVVLYENGNPKDGEWQPIFLPEPSKTLSEFVIMIIGEDIAPNPMTMFAAGFESFSSCDIDEEEGEEGDEEGEEDDGDDFDDGDDDYPCTDCEPEEDEECLNCACAECEEECDESIRKECPDDPFKPESR